MIKKGRVVEAATEIEKIEPKFKTHPFVLLTWCDIYAKARKWENVLAISETVCNATRDILDAWEHLVVALDELGRTDEAITKAESIVFELEDDGTIAYHIGRFYASKGNFPLARKWLEFCFDRDFMRIYRESALKNPLFEKIWKP